MRCLFTLLVLLFVFVGSVSADSNESIAFAPVVIKGETTHTVFELQNRSAQNGVNVVISFYTMGGHISVNIALSIPAGQTTVVNTATTHELAAGFIGSAVISSDLPLDLAVSLSQNGNNVPVPTFSAGASSSYLVGTISTPQTSTVYIMNVGTSQIDALVSFSGTSCTQTVTIPVGASHAIDLNNVGCLPSGYSGIVEVTTSGRSGSLAVVGVDRDASGNIVHASSGSTVPLAVGLQSVAANPSKGVSLFALILGVGTLGVLRWFRPKSHA